MIVKGVHLTWPQNQDVSHEQTYHCAAGRGGGMSHRGCPESTVSPGSVSAGAQNSMGPARAGHPALMFAEKLCPN